MCTALNDELCETSARELLIIQAGTSTSVEECKQFRMTETIDFEIRFRVILLFDFYLVGSVAIRVERDSCFDSVWLIQFFFFLSERDWTKVGFVQKLGRSEWENFLITPSNSEAFCSPAWVQTIHYALVSSLPRSLFFSITESFHSFPCHLARSCEMKPIFCCSDLFLRQNYLSIFRLIFYIYIYMIKKRNK